MQDDNTHVFLFWPRATSDVAKLDTAFRILGQYGEILRKEQIELNYNGYRNLLIQVYWGAEWGGTIDNHFGGIKGKVNEVFALEHPLWLVKIKLQDGVDAVRVKEEIRDVYGLGKATCHSSDTIEEMKVMEQLLLNPNSVHALNYGKIDFDQETFKRVTAFHREAKNRNPEYIDHILIDSSSVLAMYGLRKARDLDFLTDISDVKFHDADSHSFNQALYGKDFKDLLYLPENYFWSLGMKFVSIDNLIWFKEHRAEKKDLEDVSLLKNVAKPECNRLERLRIRARMDWENRKKSIRFLFEKHHLSVATKLWHFIKGKGFTE